MITNSTEYLWLLVTLAILSLCECCDRTAFMACVAPVQAYATKFKVGFSEEAEFLEVCRAMDVVTECMKPVISECPDTVTQIWSGLENSFGHMCGEEGMKIYLRHLPCLVGTPLKKEMKVCNETMTQQTQELTYEAQNHETSLQNTHVKSCRVINLFVDCMVDAVHVTCGSEAATWHRELISKLISATLASTDCTLSGCTIQGSLFVLLIAFAMTRFFTISQ